MTNLADYIQPKNLPPDQQQHITDQVEKTISNNVTARVIELLGEDNYERLLNQGDRDGTDHLEAALVSAGTSLEQLVEEETESYQAGLAYMLQSIKEQDD